MNGQMRKNSFVTVHSLSILLHPRPHPSPTLAGQGNATLGTLQTSGALRKPILKQISRTSSKKHCREEKSTTK